MFGRKKQRIIADWPALQDALTGNFDADDRGGFMQFTIEWKSEKRAQVVRVAYAPVAGLGPVAFITAPIKAPLDSATVSRAMADASRLLTGGITNDRGELALRHTVAFEGILFEELDGVIRQLAASADEFTQNLAE